ncbi:MAG: rhombosortase [Vitreoscilla sp.]|nr:rhombosortase [Vitreoscilla sp.]MBP6674303.1 rhombosortase [Vitreoscilla sp.]
MSRRRGWLKPGLAWLTLAGLLAAGSLALSGAETALWDWQPNLAWQEPWRDWSAALLHWSPQHLHMNLLGTVLMAALGWRAAMQPADTLAWALAWPLTQLGLLMQPALLHYAGLSGVLHAGVAIVACRLLQSRSAGSRRIGGLLALGMVAKLLLELPWRGAAQAVAGMDFSLAPLAHVSGAVMGLLCFVLCDALMRLRGRATTPASKPDPR